MGTRERTPKSRLTMLAGLTGLVSLTTTGCSTGEILRFGWPQAVTPQAARMRDFWTWSVVAALVVGVITWALILWPVIAHRKRGDKLPRQFQYNHFLEYIYTGLPVLIVLVLFYFTVITENYVLAKKSADEVDVTVDVYAFQWNWDFGYESYRDTTGATVVPRVPAGPLVRTIGSSSEIPLLVLPTERTIQYNLRGRDVIHSFFVPEFNFKRDVFPAPDKNNQDSSFQNTIDREGSFVGRCAELCGTYHSAMNFEVRAISPERFDAYMLLRRMENPDTGKTYTAAEALAKMGRDDPNCGELCSPHALTTQPFDSRRNRP